MCFQRNPLASEKGAGFAALVSDYGRARGSNGRTGPLLGGAPGAAGGVVRIPGERRAWGLSPSRRALRLRGRTWARRPVRAATAATSADPAAVTPSVYLGTARPLPEALAACASPGQPPGFVPAGGPRPLGKSDGEVQPPSLSCKMAPRKGSRCEAVLRMESVLGSMSRKKKGSVSRPGSTSYQENRNVPKNTVISQLHLGKRLAGE